MKRRDFRRKVLLPSLDDFNKWARKTRAPIRRDIDSFVDIDGEYDDSEGYGYMLALNPHAVAPEDHIDEVWSGIWILRPPNAKFERIEPYTQVYSAGISRSAR